jgi:enamine deaminase RidA (YjgF/YER057c/UK114 family)
MAMPAGDEHSRDQGQVDAPIVDERLEVARTNLGEVVRLDIANLGARIPSGLAAGGDGGPPGQVSETLQGRRWAAAQNVALCDTLSDAAGAVGGGFDSLAEWTVLYARGFYDGGHMRDTRAARFEPGYRAAITTLAAADPRRGWGVRVAGEAYVGQRPGALSLVQWQPKSLYATEFMALAPAVVASFGGAELVYFSGLVAWDQDIRPLHTEDPRRQVRLVLDMLEACLSERGGSRANVVRLRPFTHSPETARIIRDEIGAFWAHEPPPSSLLFDATSFGNPPKLHLELQAFAVLPAAGYGGHPTGAFERRVLGAESASATAGGSGVLIRAGSLEMVSLGDVRPASETSDESREAASVVDRLTQHVAAAGLRLSDVRRIFAYATTDGAAEALQSCVRAVTDAAVHVVPCAPFPDLQGKRLKVEAFAVRAR